MKRRDVLKGVFAVSSVGRAGCLDSADPGGSASTDPDRTPELVAVVDSDPPKDIAPIASEHERLADADFVRETLDDAVQDGASASRRLSNERLDRFESAMAEFEYRDPDGAYDPDGYYVEHEDEVVVLFVEILQ